MDFFELTNEYYAYWLGVEKNLLKEKGVFFFESQERDKQQIGYPQPFHLVIYITEALIIVSYSQSLESQIQNLSKTISNDIEIQALVENLEEKIKRPVIREIKFYLDGLSSYPKSNQVVKLTNKQYEDYFEFFKKQHPTTKETSWLKEYFEELCSNELIFGIYEDGNLVCVSDAPDMPYMEDNVQEIGINTLATHRHKGYAQLVTQRCVQSIIDHNKCPLWSCLQSNHSSENLAYKIGFKKLAEVLKITL